jgi:methyl-accepting chemotaxis protein
MNIFSKILMILLPFVFLFIFIMASINYYFSTKALNSLAESWLSGKLTMAMQILDQQENNLRMYGLEAISASRAKARLDAGKSFLDIDMGDQGYLFAVSSTGIIAIHSDENKIGKKLENENGFEKTKKGEKKTTYLSHDKADFAIFEYFAPWDLFVVAADPVTDFYGPANKIKPYLLVTGLLGSIVLALILMFLLRRVMLPLKSLTHGVKQVGMGNLDARILIRSNDEFNLLAREFNNMTQNLQNITVSRDDLEREIQEKNQIDKERKKVIKDLTAALDEIKTLKGIVPICANCKKIRDDKGYWDQLETYIEKHSDASFSHGMCPDCSDEMYGNEDWYIQMKAKKAKK